MLVRRFSKFAFPLVAIAAGAFLLAGCHGRHCGWKNRPEQKAEHIVKRLAKELDLNEDQKTKLDKIKTEILLRKADFKVVHSGIHDEIFSQLKASSVDQGKLNQAFEDREAKMKELRTFLISEFAEFQAILTPNQREKLVAKLQEFCP